MEYDGVGAAGGAVRHGAHDLRVGVRCHGARAAAADTYDGRRVYEEVGAGQSELRALRRGCRADGCEAGRHRRGEVEATGAVGGGGAECGGQLVDGRDTHRRHCTAQLSFVTAARHRAVVVEQRILRVGAGFDRQARADVLAHSDGDGAAGGGACEDAPFEAHAARPRVAGRHRQVVSPMASNGKPIPVGRLTRGRRLHPKTHADDGAARRRRQVTAWQWQEVDAARSELLGSGSHRGRVDGDGGLADVVLLERRRGDDRELWRHSRPEEGGGERGRCVPITTSRDVDGLPCRQERVDQRRRDGNGGVPREEDSRRRAGRGAGDGRQVDAAREAAAARLDDHGGVHLV